MDPSWVKPASGWTSPLLLLVAVVASIIVPVAGDVLTACYDGSSQKTIDVHCGEGAMVRILNTFYGYSEHGACSYSQGDCTLKETAESYSCVGTPTCSLPLKWAEEGGVMMPNCEHRRSNYFQVEYQCVPKYMLNDICRTSQLTTQSGYIVTPNYPLPSFYDSQSPSLSLTCNVTIVVAPTQKLRLNIIRLDLMPKGKTDCTDYLYFNDKLKSMTLCGLRNNMWYDMHSNFLHVELQATSLRRNRGFWLYYEAYPPLPTTAPPTPLFEETTQKSADSRSFLMSTLQPPQRVTSGGNQALTPIPIYRDDDRSSAGTKSLPFAAIAGGVIGTLSLVLIILLLLLLVKWLKERHYFKDEKFLEIRNPAFRSSGDFNEPNNAYCNP